MTLRIAGQLTLPGSAPDIRFDPTGRWIAAAYVRNIVFWPVGRPNRYVLPGDVGDFTPDGRLLVYSGVPVTASLRVQDLVGGAPQDLWRVQQGINFTVSFDPHRKYMGVGAENGCYVLSLADGRARQIPSDRPGGSYRKPAFSMDGRRVATARADKEAAIYVWDLEANTVQVLEQSRGQHFWDFTFAEDGSLFSSDFTGQLRRWNIRDGSSTVVYESQFPKGAMDCLTFTRDARVLVVCDGSPALDQTYVGVATLIDAEHHTSRAISSHGNRVWSLGLDAAKTFLTTSSYDGTVRVGPISGEEPHVLRVGGGEMTSARISPDGSWIAAQHKGDASKSAVCLLRRPGGPPLHTIPHEELLSRLRALTNLRVVPDKTSQTGYRFDKLPFAGWKEIPVQ